MNLLLQATSFDAVLQKWTHSLAATAVLHMQYRCKQRRLDKVTRVVLANHFEEGGC